jgi:hypothetical protein
MSFAPTLAPRHHLFPVRPTARFTPPVKKVLLLVAMSLALTVARAEVRLNFWQESRDKKAAEFMSRSAHATSHDAHRSPPPRSRRETPCLLGVLCGLGSVRSVTKSLVTFGTHDPD